MEERQALVKKLTRNEFLDQWVREHPGGWNHDEWLGLLSDLKVRKYRFAPDNIGLYIEKRRKQFFS